MIMCPKHRLLIRLNEPCVACVAEDPDCPIAFVNDGGELKIESAYQSNPKFIRTVDWPWDKD